MYILKFHTETTIMYMLVIACQLIYVNKRNSDSLQEISTKCKLFLVFSFIIFPSLVPLIFSTSFSQIFDYIYSLLNWIVIHFIYCFHLWVSFYCFNDICTLFKAWKLNKYHHLRVTTIHILYFTIQTVSMNIYIIEIVFYLLFLILF
jgi:hypothetical protein